MLALVHLCKWEIHQSFWISLLNLFICCCQRNCVFQTKASCFGIVWISGFREWILEWRLSIAQRGLPRSPREHAAYTLPSCSCLFTFLLCSVEISSPWLPATIPLLLCRTSLGRLAPLAHCDSEETHCVMEPSRREPAFASGFVLPCCSLLSKASCFPAAFLSANRIVVSSHLRWHCRIEVQVPECGVLGICSALGLCVTVNLHLTALLGGHRNCSKITPSVSNFIQHCVSLT